MTLLLLRIWSAHPMDTLLSHEAMGEEMWMQHKSASHMAMKTWHLDHTFYTIYTQKKYFTKYKYVPLSY